MADESDLEKTEPASPQRLEKAREEGQTARSRELNTFAILATGAAGLWFGGPALYRALGRVLHSGLGFDPRLGRDPFLMTAVALDSALLVFSALLPLFGLLMAAAVLSSISLGGFVLSAEALRPKFERLNFVKGVSRIFSSQTLVELFKTIVKAALIGTIAASVIWNHRDPMMGLMHATAARALADGMVLVAVCCGLVVGSLLLVVLIDAPWQVWTHLKKMRMSREDVRQEHKESEGDPHVKSRMRQQQRSMARRRMMSEVPRADVVVTNPTHYAVALAYDGAGASAPRMVAKGSGFLAARIRQVAAQHGVPLFESPPLARALWGHMEIGEEIPAELYGAVAQVLAWVYQLRQGAPGAGPGPRLPDVSPIPPGFDIKAGRAGTADP